MRLVPINCIKEGSYLAKTIFDSDGRILLTKGVKLTQGILAKTEELGILSLYINDEYSDSEIEDVIKPVLRQKAIKALKDCFTSLEGSKSTKIKHEQMEKLKGIVNEIIDELLINKNVLINLVDIKSMDDYTYQHCVNVMILCLVLGIELNMDRGRLYNLAMGALLHDIGKVFLPKSILLKKGRLTDEEFTIIKEHPAKGYEYLKDNQEVSAVSRIIALQHHEKMDGTGYPEGIKGSKIHEFARIAAIADVYDALTSDRPYRMGMPPSEALEYLMGGVERHFDYNMVKAFLKRVTPYPIGTLVKLSNGNIGVVEALNHDFPLRPKLKIIDGSKTFHLDLMDNISVVIEGVEIDGVENKSVLQK